MTSRPECRSQPETGSWVGVKDVKHDASGLSRNTKLNAHFLSDDQSQQKKGRRLVQERGGGWLAHQQSESWVK